MIEVIVTVEFNGRNYQTNVIGNKDMPEDEIRTLAEKQVINQWRKFVN
ncbi:molecular chaperone [Mesobacillus campisalis]|uniref:Molecular chaperone n=1 Tax=Mesobacillus campisalis TaxID=1408103 RepID=A0A0M2SZX1_9BACI|nr:BA3454 family stress response protein [Mesobacillus campisalis]KKK38150.1 molecular chaperone [Mesobacillus campisalis]